MKASSFVPLLFGRTAGVPLSCLRVGSLAQTADARMFELPASDNCGQYLDTGDTLCIGNHSLRIVRKWGLAVQLEGSHGAKVGDNFRLGSCAHETRRILFPVESISTAVSLVLNNFRQRVSALLVEADGSAGRILSSSVISDSRLVSVLPLPEELRSPRDVAALDDGSFLLCDAANHRVVLLIGNSLDVVAGNGVTTTARSPQGGVSLSQLKFPIAIAVTPAPVASVRRYAALFVLDAGNFRLVRWRFAALRGEVVWEAPRSSREEISGFGKLVIGNAGREVRFVVKKKHGDVLLTLRGAALVPSEEISDTPSVLWTVDDGSDASDAAAASASGNIYLSDLEISEENFPGVHDLAISEHFLSSRVQGKTWKRRDGEASAAASSLGGFVAIAGSSHDELLGINEDGVVWNRLNSSPGTTAGPLIRDEL